MALTEMQKLILQGLADRYRVKSDPVHPTGMIAIAGNDAGAKARFESGLTELLELELVRRDDTSLWLTLDGWLSTSFRTEVWLVIETTLKISRAQARAGVGIPAFGWADLRSRSGLSDDLRSFAWCVLREANIGHQAGYGSNGVSFQASEDHDRWDAVSSLADFLPLYRREAAERLIRTIRLRPDERTAAEVVYSWFQTHGEWPRSQPLNISLHAQSVNLAEVVGASFVLRGAEVTWSEARTYLTLHGLVVLESARQDLDGVPPRAPRGGSSRDRREDSRSRSHSPQG